MKPRIESIIFDLDGVLCSTDEYHFQAWLALAQSRGIPFDWEINQRLRGVSRMESLEIILERSSCTYTQAEKEAMAEEKNRHYQALLAEMTPRDLAPMARETLELLRGRGFRLAVGSSSKNTKLILRQIGLADFFDAVADGTIITKSKPDPEVFLLAAQLVQTPPANCVVVEDAVAGIQAGIAAGMTTVGMAERETASCADYFVESFSQLARLPLLAAAAPH